MHKLFKMVDNSNILVSWRLLKIYFSTFCLCKQHGENNPWNRFFKSYGSLLDVLYKFKWLENCNREPRALFNLKVKWFLTSDLGKEALHGKYWMLPVALNSRNSVQNCINSLVLKMLNGITRSAVKIEKIVQKKNEK